jgi:hypothetical protein
MGRRAVPRTFPVRRVRGVVLQDVVVGLKESGKKAGGREGKGRRTNRISNHAQRTFGCLFFLLVIFRFGLDVLLLRLFFFLLV